MVREQGSVEGKEEKKLIYEDAKKKRGLKNDKVVDHLTKSAAVTTGPEVSAVGAESSDEPGATAICGPNSSAGCPVGHALAS